MYKELDQTESWSKKVFFAECPFCRTVFNLTYSLEIDEDALDECPECFADFKVIYKGLESSNHEISRYFTYKK